MPTDRGIRCAHCKGRHDTVAQVRLCAHRAGQPSAEVKAAVTAALDLVAESEREAAEWVAWKDLAARREQTQEEEAYLAEMARDNAIEAAHLRRVAAQRQR